MKKSVLILLMILMAALSSLGQNNVVGKGNDYLNSGQYEKAEKTFRDGLKDEPKNLIYQCQLALTLIQQKKYLEAENTLNRVLAVDSSNVGAIWYSGVGNFYNSKYKQAVKKFEKALTLVDKQSAQNYSGNWFAGTCYSNLLKTEGLTFAETNRMFECYNEYLRLQPNAPDAGKIKEYIERKKSRRPPENVIRWIDL